MTTSHTILLTGAAGAIGQVLRPALRPHCRLLRCADLVAVDGLADNEEAAAFDLRDADAVHEAMRGVDIVFHFGGHSLEEDWPAIRDVNIDGTFNVYEAARLQGARRVIFASSNHALGFCRRDRTVGPAEPVRPDSRYGVSKVFGEAIGRLYADKHGLETIALRIGQFRPEPTNLRMLSLWLSHADMARLAIRCVKAQDVHFEIVYGISANRRAWYDNPGAARIGYAPEDDAELYADRLTEAGRTETEIEAAFQGGPFCDAEFTGAVEDVT